MSTFGPMDGGSDLRIGVREAAERFDCLWIFGLAGLDVLTFGVGGVRVPSLLQELRGWGLLDLGGGERSVRALRPWDWG